MCRPEYFMFSQTLLTACIDAPTYPPLKSASPSIININNTINSAETWCLHSTCLTSLNITFMHSSTHHPPSICLSSIHPATIRPLHPLSVIPLHPPTVHPSIAGCPSGWAADIVEAKPQPGREAAGTSPRSFPFPPPSSLLPPPSPRSRRAGLWPGQNPWAGRVCSRGRGGQGWVPSEETLGLPGASTSHHVILTTRTQARRGDSSGKGHSWARTLLPQPAPPTPVLGTGPRALSRQSKALQMSPLRAATAKGAGALESHHLGSHQQEG